MGYIDNCALINYPEAKTFIIEPELTAQEYHDKLVVECEYIFSDQWKRDYIEHTKWQIENMEYAPFFIPQITEITL